MKPINRNNLTLFLATFLLVVNLLVIFNVNQFYIRAILAFIFIIGVPGLLIMLMLRVREVSFWEYLVYTVGLSVSFIMFGGLAVNWGLPALHITDKPLSLYPILVCFDIFLIVMGFVAYKRNKDLDFKIKFPKFSWLDRIFIIIPMAFPVMAVLGAFILNNFGPNYLTMIMLGSIAVYVLLIVIFRDKLNENVFPWAILMISLSVLLASSMRSWFVSGVDVSLEHNIFMLTKEKAFWSISNYRHAYNAMLSVSILPTIFYTLTKIPEHLVFKLPLTILFSVLPVSIFCLFKKYFNKSISFLGVLFFIFQPMFLSWFSIPVRQQIAFLFLGLSFLVLFSKFNNSNSKVLFLIFSFCVIVSHYSTAYIALGLFLFSFILIKLSNFIRKKTKICKRKFSINYPCSINLIFLCFLLAISINRRIRWSNKFH